MSDIQKWINSGCDYDKGVALYSALPGHLPALLANLKLGKNAVRHEKLKYELKKALRSDQAPEIQVAAVKQAPTVVPAPPPEPPAQDVKQKLLFHQLPAEMRPVLKEANALFAEKCMLKVALNELAPEMESEALAIQLQIFDLTKRNALCWQKIDYWREHKRLPQAAAHKHESLGGAKLHKRQQNLFSSISRLKKRLEHNRTLLPLVDSIKELAKLQRALAKQEANLLRQEEELQQITARIDNRE